MTERITPEQATGKPPSHVLSSALIDAANSLFCKLVQYEREIERLQVIEKAAAHMDAVMGSDRLGRNESAVISEAAVWLEDALNGITDEPDLRYWYETLDAALTPPPAREEGVND